MKRGLLMMLLTAAAGNANAADFKPLQVDRFFVTPHETAVLRWQAESNETSGPVEYTIRDYWGKSVASGKARATAENALEAMVTLGPGFFDVELAGSNRRFGIVSIPAYRGKGDPFFCIDSALSWLVHRDEVREGLIRALRRSGVVMSRERLNWGDVCRAEDQWNWEASHRNDTVRRLHAKHHVEVLEMFHDAPGWTGLVGKYPDDLVGTARAWQQIAGRWQSTWGAMEVWNEPDIFFGANLSADQYVALVKTFAWAFADGRVRSPLVGGAFAHYHRAYLDNAARNGMLDCLDVVSFHTYARADAMQKLVGDYRSWLKAHGREAMPLWITECGRPWKRGPDRPPADQGAESALDITAKAIEARVCGVARHFPFVYPYYEERTYNFGMMGRRATPLRSMAAYVRLVSSLAHKRYLGDLPCDDTTVQRARVFGDDRETVVVLCATQPNKTARIKLGLPALRVEGIDGRRLEAAADGSIPIPDGLSYVWLDREKLGKRLLSDTPAMLLWTIAQQKPAPRSKPSPIVLRFQADGEVMEGKTEGYHLLAKSPGRLSLCVRAFNLSGQPHDLSLRLAFSEKAVSPAGSQIRALKLPAEGFADVTWEADFGGAFPTGGRLTVTVTATGPQVGPVAPLVIDLLPAP